MLTPREKSLCQRLRGGLNLRGCIKQDSEPNTLSALVISPHALGAISTFPDGVIPVTSKLVF